MGYEWVPFVHEYERVAANGQRFYWSGEFLHTNGPLGHYVFDGAWMYLPKYTAGFGSPWCGFQEEEVTYTAVPHSYLNWGFATPSMWTFPDTRVLQNTRPFPRWP